MFLEVTKHSLNNMLLDTFSLVDDVHAIALCIRRAQRCTAPRLKRRVGLVMACSMAFQCRALSTVQFGYEVMGQLIFYM